MCLDGVESSRSSEICILEYIVEVSEEEDHSNRRVKAFTTAP